MADTDVVVHDFSDGSVDGSDAGIEDVCLDGGPDANAEGCVAWMWIEMLTVEKIIFLFLKLCFSDILCK